ncbi:MAG: hypothetical protein MJY75_01190 [Bacteroidaceae bacterium]|nr:hypothetical protein [Bacteroidaceae bacterium]
MKISESSYQEIRKLIQLAVEPYRKSQEQQTVTDIHLQPVRETGEFLVSDDDRVLASVQLSDLTEIPEDVFYSVMENSLKSVLKLIDREQPLEQLAIWKPFSFVLADDEGETVTELMLFDDDNTLLSQGLMQGLEEDLDRFLDELLEI